MCVSVILDTLLPLARVMFGAVILKGLAQFRSRGRTFKKLVNNTVLSRPKRIKSGLKLNLKTAENKNISYISFSKFIQSFSSKIRHFRGWWHVPILISG